MKRSLPEPQRGCVSSVGTTFDGLRKQECLYCKNLYGCDVTVSESPSFVVRKIREIERKMDKLSDPLKEAYYVALEQEIKQNLDYIRSFKFLLAFLRADCFDSSKAALRLAKFLKFKLDLFGPEKLPHRITFDDLNDDDRKVLATGYVHFIGVDCGGRLAFVSQRDRLRLSGVLNERYSKSLLRVPFYVLMSGIEDNEQHQNRGLVGVRWSLNSTLTLKEYRILFHSSVKFFYESLPIKIVAIHSCCSKHMERLCMSWVESLSQKDKDINYESRIHGPSASECLSALSRNGIDVDALPQTASGGFNSAVYRKLLKQMRKNELSRRFPGTEHSTVDDDDFMNYISSIAEMERNRNEIKSSPVLVKDLSPTIGETSDFKDTKSHSLYEENLASKLMEILQANIYQDAIWWSRGGNAFVIEKEKFQETVLPREFKGIKMDSFIRRLKRWGFQRLTYQGTGLASSTLKTFMEFQNDFFVQHSPERVKDLDKLSRKDKLPLKLKKILDNNSAPDSIWWINNGKDFVIQKTKFTTDIIQNYFEGTKFESFKRLMRRWGFKRLSDPTMESCNDGNLLAFHHPMFQQNLVLTPEMLEKWNCADNLCKMGGMLQHKKPKPKTENFAKKLFRIVESGNFSNAIWWSNDGESLIIRMAEFSHVLTKEYKGIKFSSFCRSLKRWGFEKLHSDDNLASYRCPSLNRNGAIALDKGHTDSKDSRSERQNGACQGERADKGSSTPVGLNASQSDFAVNNNAVAATCKGVRADNESAAQAGPSASQSDFAVNNNAVAATHTSTGNDPSSQFSSQHMAQYHVLQYGTRNPVQSNTIKSAQWHLPPPQQPSVLSYSQQNVVWD